MAAEYYTRYACCPRGTLILSLEKIVTNFHQGPTLLDIPTCRCSICGNVFQARFLHGVAWSTLDPVTELPYEVYTKIVQDNIVANKRTHALNIVTRYTD